MKTQQGTQMQVRALSELLCREKGAESGEKVMEEVFLGLYKEHVEVFNHLLMLHLALGAPFTKVTGTYEGVKVELDIIYPGLSSHEAAVSFSSPSSPLPDRCLLSLLRHQVQLAPRNPSEEPLCLHRHFDCIESALKLLKQETELSLEKIPEEVQQLLKEESASCTGDANGTSASEQSEVVNDSSTPQTMSDLFYFQGREPDTVILRSNTIGCHTSDALAVSPALLPSFRRISLYFDNLVRGKRVTTRRCSDIFLLFKTPANPTDKELLELIHPRAILSQITGESQQVISYYSFLSLGKNLTSKRKLIKATLVERPRVGRTSQAKLRALEWYLQQNATRTKGVGGITDEILRIRGYLHDRTNSVNNVEDSAEPIGNNRTEESSLESDDSSIQFQVPVVSRALVGEKRKTAELHDQSVVAASKWHKPQQNKRNLELDDVELPPSSVVPFRPLLILPLDQTWIY